MTPFIPDEFLLELITLIKKLSRGEHINTRLLVEVAGKKDCPLLFSETARAFSLLVTMVKAKEAGLYSDIRRLSKENQNLELTREKLADAVKNLRGASLETIYRLVLAAEYKDEDTSSHIQRMSHYSAAVARAMELPEKMVDHILYASPMHDVGKIGIPDWILLKPGKLDEGEWEIMKTHTTIGAGILEGSASEIIQMAETIAISHHERWDGSGYPFGLKGEDIPLEGRIVAIGDVFDALTSKRPYKDAYSEEHALSIITKEAGRHFDPTVVEAFLATMEEILSIKKKFKETDFTPPQWLKEIKKKQDAG
ncbi:MAG: HD domain-containing phosphohydrolase [Thermodesulfobacteriota bacterium]